MISRISICVLTLVTFGLPGPLGATKDSARETGDLPYPARSGRVTQAAGTGEIRGRVTAADSGEPLSQVEVRAVSLAGGESRTVLSDDVGHFQMPGLPPGRYELTGSKQGFVAANYGQSDPLDPGKRVEVRPNAIIDGADLKLPRGGVIVGRISDEAARPLPGVRVGLLRGRFTNGGRRLTPGGGAATSDDRGEFRLFGLTPGRYYLIAVPPTSRRSPSTQVEWGHAPTYYPGTTTVDDAQPISVSAGSTADATLALVRAPLVNVSGIVTGIDGGAVAGGAVSVRVEDGIGARAVVIAADGTFVITGLAAGLYFLRSQDRFSLPGEATRFSAATVRVENEDVRGLILQPVRTSTVRGRVAVPPEALKSFPASAITVGLEPAGFENSISVPRFSTVRGDLTFELSSWPGPAFVRVLSRSPDWAMKSIRFRGVDVTDKGIECASGQTVDGIEIELTNHPPEVSGTVTTAEGDPVWSFGVVFFSQDQERWQDSRYLALERPDQHGRFVIRSLPPGRYYAVASSTALFGGDWNDPVILNRLRAVGTRFSVAESESKSLRLVFTRTW